MQRLSRINTNPLTAYRYLFTQIPLISQSSEVLQHCWNSWCADEVLIIRLIHVQNCPSVAKNHILLLLHVHNLFSIKSFGLSPFYMLTRIVTTLVFLLVYITVVFFIKIFLVHSIKYIPTNLTMCILCVIDKK